MLQAAEALAEGENYVAQNALLWIRGKQLLQNAAVFLSVTSDDLRAKIKTGEISQFRKAAAKDFGDNAVFERLAALATGTGPLRTALRAA